MKTGDWIKINFIGRVKSTGEVFDLSKESDAKKLSLFDEKKKYGPVLIITGAGMIIPGVEKEILKLKVGGKAKFDVSPSDALGPRRPELIKIYSVSKFLEKNINPFPGMWVNMDGRNCKINSVSSGRVRVDFNHPLAGKELSYELEVVEEVVTPKKRVDSLIDYYEIEGTAAITGGNVKITHEKEVNPMMQKLIEETLKKWAKGIEKVEFASKGKPLQGKEQVQNKTEAVPTAKKE